MKPLSNLFLVILCLFPINIALTNKTLATIEDPLVIDTGTGQGMVNVRSGPGIEHEIVETVPSGTTVMFCSQCVQEEVIGKDSDGCEWYKIYLPEREIGGFVRSDLLYRKHFGPVSNTCSF